MSPLSDEVQRELSNATGGFYQPHKTLPVGQSEEITVVRYAKHTATKFPIKDKAGTSLGYTWRFWLATGQVWDVSNRNRAVLLQGLHPDGKEPVVPGRFRVTNVGAQGTKAPSQQVAYLGRVEDTQAGAEEPF